MANFIYRGLPVIVGIATRAMQAAVTEAANDLVNESVDAAPIDEGTLRGSIKTDGAKLNGNVATAKIKTGGESSDYAAVQHEHTEFKHLEGQAKYIEGPLLANANRYKDYIAAQVRAVF